MTPVRLLRVLQHDENLRVVGENSACCSRPPLPRQRTWRWELWGNCYVDRPSYAVPRASACAATKPDVIRRGEEKVIHCTKIRLAL
eukprot:s33_g90.t1